MRAIAIIGVVTIHTFNSAIIYFGKATTNLTLVLYDAVLNMMWYAVPCFFYVKWRVIVKSRERNNRFKISEKIHIENGINFTMLWYCFFFDGNYIHYQINTMCGCFYGYYKCHSR